MSALLRWRCDICGSEAEVVQEVPRAMFTFFSPKLPEDWRGSKPAADNTTLDLCSQACVVVYQQQVLVREQRKLVDHAN